MGIFELQFHPCSHNKVVLVNTSSVAIASRVNKPIAVRTALERGKGLILSATLVDTAQAIASYGAVPVVVGL
jgi:hypothetical protein